MTKQGDKQQLRSLALQRIIALFEQAALLTPYSQKTADSYVRRAWNIATSNRVRMPLALKRSFCRKCKSHWRYGKTVRVRLHGRKKVYTCLICGAIKRIPYG